MMMTDGGDGSCDIEVLASALTSSRSGMEPKELKNEVLEALYPETQILEYSEVLTEQKCYRCGETFQNQQSKIKHMREAHLGSYICPVCGKAFSQRSGLTHHIPTHSNVKAFQCNICGKAFRQRSGLTHHKQTHSLVKSFNCDICGKSFAQGSGLIHHKSTHSSVKSFVCDICGKGFAQRSGLAHHKHIHEKKLYPVPIRSSTDKQMIGGNLSCDLVASTRHFLPFGNGDLHMHERTVSRFLDLPMVCSSQLPICGGPSKQSP